MTMPTPFHSEILIQKMPASGRVDAPRLSAKAAFRAVSLLSLLLPVLLLSGCAGKDYALPEPAAMGIMDEQMVLAEYGLNQAWWRGYDDPKLNALVEMALARNVDLAKSAISVNKALYQARLLGADLVPSFSADASAGSTTNTKIGEASRTWGSGLSVSYELDLWHKLRDSASAQTWEYQATTQDRESARLALINSVVDGYYNLIYLRESMAVTAQNLDFYERLYQIIENQFRAGKVDGLDPLTARQSLLAVRNSVTDLQTQIRVAEQTLRNLLNLSPDAALPIANLNLLDVRLPSVDLAVPVSALGLRPDVRAAEYRILKAFRTESATRASLYPSISVGGSLTVSSNNADTLFDIPLLGGTIKINLPFLQWNKIKWNIKISEADFENAKLNFTQAVTTALNEVDVASFSYQNTLALLENSIKKHEADVQISAYRERRYQAGTGTLKDWLDARLTENNSMISMLKAKYDAIRYENAVFKALGGRLEKK